MELISNVGSSDESFIEVFVIRKIQDCINL